MTIEFQGKEYPVRCIPVHVNGEGWNVLVSTESLERALFENDGVHFVSEEAIEVDEDIYFYVPDDIIDADEDALCGFVEEMTA